jgi:DNA-directed RNA polymerase subunit K/omega
MIARPPNSNAFEFARVSALRAAQLMAGCVPRVPESDKPAITAQREVAEGKIRGTSSRTTAFTEAVEDEPEPGHVPA